MCFYFLPIVEQKWRKERKLTNSTDEEPEDQIPVRKHRWLVFFLFFQSMMFAIPNLIWKGIDNGKFKVYIFT